MSTLILVLQLYYWTNIIIDYGYEYKDLLSTIFFSLSQSGQSAPKDKSHKQSTHWICSNLNLSKALIDWGEVI